MGKLTVNYNSNQTAEFMLSGDKLVTSLILQ